MMFFLWVWSNDKNIFGNDYCCGLLRGLLTENSFDNEWEWPRLS